MSDNSGNNSFSNLHGLNSEGPEAARKLHNVCTRLRNAGAVSIADRIAEIDPQVRRLDYEELERQISPDHVIDELIASYERPWWKKNASGERGKFHRWVLNLPWSVRSAHLVRNTFALLPLIFTWLMLAAAAVAYQSELHSHPDAGNQPFLLLWQRGFSRHFFPFNWRVPPFGWVAVIDVLLLVLVVAFTWWVHQAEASADRFADLLHDAMRSLKLAVSKDRIATATSAEEWTSQASRVLDRAIGETELLTKAAQQAIDVGTQAIEAASTRLEGVQGESRQFLTDMQASNQKFLADFQDKTTGLIDKFSKEFIQALGQARSQNAEFMRQTADQNREAVRQLVEEVIDPLVGQVGILLTDFRRQQAEYTTAVTDLRQSVADIGGSAAELATSAQAFAGSTQSIAGSLATMADAQERFASQVEGSARSMDMASTAMTEVKDALRTDLHDRLVEIAINITAASSRLDRTQASLEATASALGKSAMELKDAIKGTVSVLRQAATIAKRRRAWWERLLRLRRSDEAGGS